MGDLLVYLIVAAVAALAGYQAGAAVSKRRGRASEIRTSGENAQLSRRLSALETDGARMAAILSGMVEGVLVVDGDGRLRLANDAARSMLKLDTNLIGRHYVEAVRQPGVVQQLGAALKGEDRAPIEVPLDFGSGAAGGPRIFRAQARPASADGGGAVLVLHDISDLRRVDRVRRDFVANVSHELRTPLTVIKGFTETLRDGALRDPVSGPKFLATIERHVDQLTNLVSDLLELSRLESTPELPRQMSFDAGAMVRRAADLLQPAAQRKEQSMAIDIRAGLPRVIGNPEYIERAVSNLIDNAIKYTPERGKIKVCVTHDSEQVTVEVADNGIGIPPQDLSRVFERFYRVDRSRSRDMGGTGLGLSIVKHVAQVHGGSIDVVSTPGQGSRFRLKLPVTTE